MGFLYIAVKPEISRKSLFPDLQKMPSRGHKAEDPCLSGQVQSFICGGADALFRKISQCSVYIKKYGFDHDRFSLFL